MIKTIIHKISNFRVVKHLFYKHTWEPKRCTFCLAPEKHLFYITKDTINGVPCEVNVTCEKCKSVVSHWAYGYFEPALYTKHKK